MKRKHFHGGVILASLIALGIGGRASSEELSPALRRGTGSSLSMARFYSGTLSSVGQFPGKLIRLPCNSNETPDATARCEPPRHDYALMMEGNEMVHPLLPGTEEVRQELASVELEGTAVTVHGKYYPSTGAILVSRIAAPGSLRLRSADLH